MAKPIVAIVGRPNVGKSTLFNRITGGRVAIVEDTPGVTRDRLYRDAEWRGRKFTLVDTGGLDFEPKDSLASQMKQQAELAIEEADVIIFLVDGKTGVTKDDLAVVDILRKTEKPLVLAVNKIENFANPDIYDFYELGLGDPIPVSAQHGMNTGDLLDKVVSFLPDTEGKEYEPDVIKMAVIGRPNVGKSSLVNTILGVERVIVSDIPGTTRDAIDTRFTRNNQDFVIIDTAGMRRKARINLSTERYSVLRSLRAIDRSDVCLLVIDAVDGVTEQDKRIAGYAHEAGKASLILVNKWDLIEKDDKTMSRFDKVIKSELSFMAYAPTLYISALTGQRVHKVLDLVAFLSEQHSRRVPTNVLNEVIMEATRLTPPPTDKGKRLKILYTTQVGVKPPTIVFFVNEPELMHFSYERYLENQIRENFGFMGTPLVFKMRKRKEDD